MNATPCNLKRFLCIDSAVSNENVIVISVSKDIVRIFADALQAANLPKHARPLLIALAERGETADVTFLDKEENKI
jgi:hypothetical protein